MSTRPRIEARVSAQERRQLASDTRIEELAEDMTTSFTQMDARIGELSRDMTASFKQLVEYHIQQENQIDTRFNQVKEDLKAEILAAKDEIKSEIKNDMTAMENRILETTKNDMTAMENRILDAFKQSLTSINPQRPPAQ